MTKKKFDKKCKNCGKTFTAMNVRKEHCSNACKLSFYRKNNKKIFRKRCKECGRYFKSPLYKTRFCSPSCVATSKNRIGTGKSLKCKQCSENFKQKHKRHIFCSSYCKGMWGIKNSESIELDCSFCEKKFGRSIYQKSKDAKNVFCSKDCESRFRETEANDVRICEHCKQEYKCKKGDKNRFCSIECQGRWQSVFRVGINASNYDSTISPQERVKKCAVCGKNMFATPRAFEKKKYCSDKCKMNAQSTTMTSPHRKTTEILKKNRIWNRTEYGVGRFLLDCYLGKGLAIEVQGRYWHGDIRLYSAPENGIQKRADKRDKRKKLFLKEKGITVLYIWEDDIEDNPEMCEKLILKFKERNGILSNYHSMNYHVRGRSVVLNKEILTPRFEL